jgi:putative N6-adenine-specific DNA methylase
VRLDPELFISCLPGLEDLLAAELRELGLPEPTAKEPGGLTLPADPLTIYRVNLESGLAVRVLLRVAKFHCRSLGELVRKSQRLPWQEWLAPTGFAVRAESHKSRLYHRDAIAERITEGIVTHFSGRPTMPGGSGGGDGEAISVLARFQFDTCTLSLDTTGRPLTDRGYRAEAGPAPLREDLARALIMASGWDRRAPLIDPFAGVGTIPIEAALLARQMPPGAGRRFALQGTPLYDARRWRDALAAAQGRIRTDGPRILGSDRRADCIAMAERNAERAGVRAAIEWAHAPLSETPWRAVVAEAGAVVSDPPLGKRMGSAEQLGALYRALGAWLADAPMSCGIALMSLDRRLTLRTGLPLESAFLTSHGGMRVRALVRRAVAAS